MTNMLFILRAYYFSIFLLVLFSTGLPVAYASETIGTIQNSPAYAWGDKLSWINFKPTAAGITITDSGITGYAWSQNDGWINFSPTNGGVTNTPAGQLGGHAWSSGKGWINFSGVSISSSGKFAGTAGTPGATAGQISFDCTSCDVRTDWRPENARVAVSSNTVGSRVVGGSMASTLHLQPIPLFPALGEPPIVLSPAQDGIVIQKSKAGPIIVHIPGRAIAKKLIILVEAKDITSLTVPPPLPDAIPVNEAYFEIVALSTDGQEIHEFKAPIRIILPLPRDLRNIQRLAVYWYDEEKQIWNIVPDAVFFDDHAVIDVSHITRFAIFATLAKSSVMTPTVVQVPGSGTIITKEKNVDISLQAKTIAESAEGVPLPSSPAPTVRRIPASEQKQQLDMNGLVVITATLIALLAYILAKQKLNETK